MSRGRGPGMRRHHYCATARCLRYIVVRQESTVELSRLETCTLISSAILGPSLSVTRAESLRLFEPIQAFPFVSYRIMFSTDSSERFPEPAFTSLHLKLGQPFPLLLLQRIMFSIDSSERFPESLFQVPALVTRLAKEHCCIAIVTRSSING